MIYVCYLCIKIQKYMKKTLVISTLILFVFSAMFAQNPEKPFKGRFENKEYNVYLKRLNSFCWLITGSKVKSKTKATIELINEYGSEDLEATLTLQGDSLLTLKQGEGSNIKVPNKGKWQKLPDTLVFKKK